MKPVFLGEVTVCSPIKLDEEKQKATFTAKHGGNRFYIRTVGLAQYEMMADLEDAGIVKLMVLGYLYSYISTKCGNDHHGIEPIWMVNLDCYDGNPAALHNIAIQWIGAALAKFT